MPDTETLYDFDRSLASTHGVLTGIDEAGRGPLAGPVVAAAVQLDLSCLLPGLNDSKKVSAARREELFARICSSAAWAVGIADPREIDKRNILQASLLAMYRAVCTLACTTDLYLVDGNRPVPHLRASSQIQLVQGDARSASIAAASICAKVTRDRLMQEADKEFPWYGFGQHKGYPTPAHIRSLRENGPCCLHRLSFCEKIIAQTSLALEI